MRTESPSKMYPLLSKAFNEVPSNWPSFFVSDSSGVVEVNPEMTDFSQWKPIEVFYYTSPYALLVLLTSAYSITLKMK